MWFMSNKNTLYVIIVISVMLLFHFGLTFYEKKVRLSEEFVGVVLSKGLTERQKYPYINVSGRRVGTWYYNNLFDAAEVGDSIFKKGGEFEIIIKKRQNGDIIRCEHYQFR